MEPVVGSAQVTDEGGCVAERRGPSPSQVHSVFVGSGRICRTCSWKYFCHTAENTGKHVFLNTV